MKNGVKISLFKANKLYDYSMNIKDFITSYDYKSSVMPNSLFLDYLLENGLRVSKNGFTRDLIGIEFVDDNKPLNVQSYEKRVQNIQNKESLDDEIKKQMLDRLEQVKDKIKEMNITELREELYTKGLVVPYKKTINKGKTNERVVIDETIEYKMLFRSTGKAKKGSIIFINKKLYNKAINFLRMGIELPKENAKIVEISAYSPLVSSSIVGKVHIDPRNILILNDVDSFFKTKIVNVGVDENNQCITNIVDNYELKNTMFDGQSLIDSSIFPKDAEGYVLLRHHFFKSASFCCHIQKFFKDYYKDDYENAQVEDMWGNKHFVKDIKLITTDNSIKWKKFGITYGYWCDRVNENGCMFGIVKTAHKSKLGDVQKMSYQMVNCLNYDTMDKVVEDSLKYIDLLKNDNDTFLDYLSKNDGFSNDYEVLLALVNQDSDFIYSDYFKKRRKEIIGNYVRNFRTGKIIQNADNLVFVGSPYAMLLHSVGENVENDKTLVQEDGVIQCYTERFDDGEYLAGFRSPHNSQNNIGYFHNVYSREMQEYFCLGEQILAINVNHTDVQDRMNGCDFDSDSGYITNQPQIVEHAKSCYREYPTIVNNIPLLGTSSYGSSMKDFATLDSKLVESQKAIGQSSNLAQIALTYGFNFDDDKYKMYACILSVLA